MHLTKLVKLTRPSPLRGSSSTPASHTSPTLLTCTSARAASSSPGAGPAPRPARRARAGAALHASLENRVEARLLGVEYPSRAGHLERLHPGDLGDAPVRGEVAAQDREVALGVERPLPAPHHLLLPPRRPRNAPQHPRD